MLLEIEFGLKLAQTNINLLMKWAHLELVKNKSCHYRLGHGNV